MAQQKSKTNGLVYVEMCGDKPVRIFVTVKAAIAHPQDLVQLDYAEAVESIRLQVFERDNYKCTHCSAEVTWGKPGEHGPPKGEMHERVWRGNGGEISVENSTTLCYYCHHHTEAGHGKRKPWARQS